MASNESKYMITLRSSDGKEFKVLNVVAMQSKRISSMIKDACTENGIPLHINVGSKTLAKVIKYCKKHAESNNNEEDVKVWDAEFVRVEKRKLFELILAASHLDIKGLVDLTCQTMTDLIRGMSREEARKWIIDKNDYTEQLIAFANVASGMAVNDDCNLKFLELKAIRRHRFIVYKIDGKVKHVVVEKLGEPMMSYV